MVDDLGFEEDMAKGFSDERRKVKYHTTGTGGDKIGYMHFGQLWICWIHCWMLECRCSACTISPYLASDTDQKRRNWILIHRCVHSSSRVHSLLWVHLKIGLLETSKVSFLTFGVDLNLIKMYCKMRHCVYSVWNACTLMHSDLTTIQIWIYTRKNIKL